VERSRVAIVIPALNEALTVAEVVKAVIQFGVPIVVDDGSKDRTSEKATSVGALVVRHEKNLGYDEALNSGFKKAKNIGAEFILTMDADGQHNPELIKKFIKVASMGADIVIGVRSRKQRIAEILFGFFTFALYRIKDPLCGMKCYKTKVYSDCGGFDSYRSVGTELILFAARKHYKICQIDIAVRNRKDQPRFGSSFSGNLKIFRSLAIALFRLLFIK
jgi:glycosyltransferase involved in cell wall biosynthesis